MTNYEMLQTLKKRQDVLSQRIYAELAFADAYNMAYTCGFDEEIHKQLLNAIASLNPTLKDVVSIEAALAPLGCKIKEMTVLAVSHAHLDMNWMWSYDETVSITLSTFRTILNLMKEFPDFTFSQSQASTYRIDAGKSPPTPGLRPIRTCPLERPSAATSSTQKNICRSCSALIPGI